MKFALAMDSRIGGRSNNEDRLTCACTQQSALLLVADGMGGHIDGEIAAQIAVDVVAQQFRLQALPVLPEPGQFLYESIQSAQQAILDHASLRRLTEIPSTTIVVAVVQDGQLYIAYAGDSRLYLIDQGRVLFRSRDHSVVQRMIDAGFLKEGDAAAHPARNRIYNCLGAISEPEISILPPLPFLYGASILLCSDGLWGVIPDEELGRVFHDRVAPHVLPALMSVAEKRGGSRGDNLTAIAMTLLPPDAPIEGRDGFIDTEADEHVDQTIHHMLMEIELSQGLPPAAGH